MQQDITPRMSIGTKRFIHPIKLQEKNETQEKIKFRSISTGRGHVIGLARDGSVWHWTNHIMLQRVLIPLEENEHIVQVVANWNYSSVLTDKGALFIIPKPDLIIPSQAQVEPPPTQIVTPRITSRQLLEDDDALVQITGLDGYTLALTQSGQVLKIMTGNETFFQDPQHHVQHLVAFSARESENNTRDVMKRFITGNFDNFAVYTTDGQVLLGKISNTEALILPDLQNKNICKVSFGDYHCGALTNDGKLYTWGNFSSGALGHGTEHLESHQHTPTLVDALDNMFVFAIGFGGWQSSVLAIPLQQDSSSNNFERTDV
jgi:alpha-tubulin suppressor-like RCC1 family protein